MSKREPEPQPASEAESQDASWTVDVDVYLEPDGEEPSFHLKSCLPRNSNGEFVFHNNGRRGFFINFNLKDPHKTRYLFPRSAQLKDALRSRPGPSCPPKDYGQQWDEFRAVRVTPDGKTLVVRNLNDTKTKFGYALRVTKDGGESYRHLDPIGDNKNGQVSFQ